ncbi:MAG: hypothetical protein DRN13_03235 [Thermoplasmata archaeon]|nr:MAG: hypothetical protein DRN13_03235 [Thermoplasmata archaeon]
MVPKKKLIPRKRVRLCKPVKVRFKLDRNRSKDILYRLPIKTFTITVYAFRWFLFLILVYVLISLTVMFFTESYEFLRQIVTLSLGGFFGFFMGYFGWLFAHQVVVWLSGKKKEEEFFGEMRF